MKPSLLLAILLLNLYVCSSEGKEYTLEGNYFWKLYAADGVGVVKTDSYRFSIEVSNSLFRISSISQAGEDFDDEVASSDGVDCYYLKRTWPSWEGKKMGSGLREFGFVVPGTYPKNASRGVQAIWVEFLAKNFFSETTNNRYVTLDQVDYVPINDVTTDINWLQEDSSFVKELRLYSPSVLSIGGKTIKLPASFRANYLVWEVLLISTQYIESKTFPAKFEFNQYFPHTEPNHQNYDLRRIYRAEFEISRVQNSVGASGLMPEAKTIARISDARFDELLQGKNGQPNMSVGLTRLDGHLGGGALNQKRT